LEIVTAIQIIGIMFTAVNVLYIIRQRSSKCQIYLLIMYIGILINLIGYTFEIFAGSKEKAILCVQFEYVGKPFIVYSMLMFMLVFCGYKINPILKGTLLAIHVSICVLVFTCNHNGLYYSSIDYSYDGIFPHLVLGHSPIYIVYSMLLWGYLVAFLVIGFSRFKSVKSKDAKVQLTTFVVCIIVCFTGLALFMSGITKGYDTTLPAYAITASLLTLILRRYNVFDAVALAKDEALTEFQDGLIVLNNEQEGIYINNSAMNLVNGILDGKLKYYSKRDDSLKKEDYSKKRGLTEVLKVFEDIVEEEEYLIDGEKAYNISSKDIINNDKVYGHMYVLTDVTDSYNYTGRLEEEVSEKTKEVIRIQRSVIGSFATMVEARDGITGLHIKNTSNFVKVLVRAMKNSGRYPEMTEDYVEMVGEAACLHDIGKIAVPDYVLTKPGKLEPEEYKIMQNHPAEGARIIKETLKSLESDDYLGIAYDMALYHHEKWNGTGYPTGKSGINIPLSARIMAVADVYDALRSKRHYKEGFSVEKSVAIMQEGSGSHFDSQIIEVFLEHIDEIEAVFAES